ncbi:MAG: UDP-N-acetylmuramoyl-L-alanine:D-glutamate ligase [Candidatus Parcubacteria bacterium]
MSTNTFLWFTIALHMKGLHIQKNKITVIGFGVSGISVARYFLKQNIAVEVFEDKKETDFNKESISEFLSNSLFSIHFSDSEYVPNIQDSDYVIASPGVHTDHRIILLAIEKDVEFITDINAFSRIFRTQYPQGKIISVTGSNGKSTTVSLMYEVLRSASLDVYLGGNIGTSPLDYLENIKTDNPIIILETSSYQLEYLKQEDYFDVACILNLSDNHLDRYHGKKELYAQAKLGGIDKEKTKVIVNYDDEYSKKYILPNLIADTVLGVEFEHVRTSNVITVENNEIFFTDGNTKVVYVSNVKKLKIKGLHNVYNSAFVAGVLYFLEILPSSNIEEGFYTFKGLEHRIQSVRYIQDVEYINDSKSTSPDATIKALEALGTSKNIVLISGGMDKDISYDSMQQVWGDYVRSVVFLPGNANKKLKKLALDTGVEDLGEVATMKEAVNVAYNSSKSGDTVLLSPSTASFASFKSFEDRGNQFIECVEGLAR